MTGTDGVRLELAWVAPRTAPSDALPHPGTRRWQPLRLGLVDLFYYDDEQFWFHDGRLMLRGNNGTGKSKVLALTLPFLLDGSVLPRRVEPDADPKKRMEWNLLLGGAHPSTERTGYTWVEFGRVDDEGTEQFTTLGIGLKAAAGRGIVKTWYFVSSRRIGDLRLADADRVVLTQERLRDELAETRSGQVYATQEAYRRAVDEALFRLGEERYAALIDLLIQLRQPQLSKKPDEKALSAALTEALRPLDQAVVADVAESFRSLEEERAGIAAARETLTAAAEFLEHYRAYARVAARRRTTAVREANSSYEWAGRNLREAENELAAAVVEAVRLADMHDDLTQRRSALDGELLALQASPAAKDADRLNQADKAADEMEARTASAEGEAAGAEAISVLESETAAVADRRYEDSSADAERRGAVATQRANPAGLTGEHGEAVGGEAAADRILARRRDQVRHVRALVAASETAEHQASRHRAALDDAEAEQARRGENVVAAEAAVDVAVMMYGDSVHGYLSELSLLEVPGGLDDVAVDWARGVDGESPVRLAVGAAADAARQRIEQERADAEQRRRQVSADLAKIHGELAALENGSDPEPTLVPGREPAAREGRSGGSLWRLTDFVEGVSADRRAGIEAALTSAGLLDAWIFPDGTLSAGGDVVLSPTGEVVAAEALSRLLMPAVGPDTEVGAGAVAAVLDRIGLGEASGAALWIDDDGRWGAGPARGSWIKERAEFIGAGAREAHRREVMGELRARAEELENERGIAQGQIDEAVRLGHQAAAERAAYPSGSERDLVTAHERAGAARQESERAERKAGEVRAAWEGAYATAERAATELAEQAGELSLGITVESLEETSTAISAYAQALVEARAAARTLVDAKVASEQAAKRAADAASVAEIRHRELTDLRSRAAMLRAQYEALNSTVGASVAELQSRQRAVESGIEETTRELSRNAKDQIDAAGRKGSLEQKVSDLGERREETAKARDDEIRLLRAFTATGLLRVALPELPTPDPGVDDEWHLTAAITVARSAEQYLDGVDESNDAWSRSQQRVSSASTELTRQMSRHGHTAFVEQHDDVMVARVRYLAEEVDIDRLETRLAEDVSDRERLLSAREREILENHLVNEVAGHLHELILAAEGQIDEMNRELAQRKTSTGMQLRVRWRERVDGPAGLAATRELMLRSDATWTPADRTAIGDFLQAQIAGVRQADPTGGWLEHLEQALDYRHWHVFAIERLQNGQWRSASGPASGGEKALAVSVPLFAAAAAHYNSAGELAPRLILLDEAFAGIDDDSRAKSLGLLATFDLDVVMTSEREWGCYPQVPGLSIAQLSRIEGVDAVGVTRWRWDGRRRARVGEIDEDARASTGTATPDDHEPSLFR